MKRPKGISLKKYNSAENDFLENTTKENKKGKKLFPLLNTAKWGIIFVLNNSDKPADNCLCFLLPEIIASNIKR